MARQTGRRSFLKTAGIGSTGLLLGACTLTRRRRSPNIIFILIDDLGWRDAGFMGSRYYRTPAIDRLAAEGMVFSDAYAAAPNCAPSRACLLSGQYTPRHGVYTVNSSERGRARDRRLVPTPNRTELDPAIVTIAEVLGEAGYRCASLGKWHLGTGPETGPLGQGFDVNVGGNERGHPASYFSPYSNPDLPDGPAGEYLTDRLNAEAVRFIEANAERPFFLYLTHYAVHTPLQAPEDLVASCRERESDGGHRNPTYAAMIERVDAGVDRIVKTLQELGLERETVIIFFSDNGGHGRVTSMAPLRGSKGMLYEGGIRSPMIVHWPGVIATGTRCPEPVIMVDFYPTLCELAGVDPPAGQPCDGVSLIPLLRGADRLASHPLFWHFPAYLEAYADTGGPWRTTPAGAVRRGDFKLIEFFEDGRLELYNLREDIGETRNLAHDMPARRDELHALMRQWRRDLSAPVPDEPNPLYQPAERPPGRNLNGSETRKRF